MRATLLGAALSLAVLAGACHDPTSASSYARAASGPLSWMDDSMMFELDCDPTLASCVLRQLTTAEVDYITAEANRLINQWPAGDTCHRIGALILANLNMIRFTPGFWHETDPATGQEGTASADYHPRVPLPGTGRVHVAAAVDSTTPRSIADILTSVRHEFGHWYGVPGGIAPDPAAIMSDRCAGTP